MCQRRLEFLLAEFHFPAKLVKAPKPDWSTLFMHFPTYEAKALQKKKLSFIFTSMI